MKVSFTNIFQVILSLFVLLLLLVDMIRGGKRSMGFEYEV